MTTAGIILCGGQSRRMGRAKADLRFGPESMLERVARLVGEAVDRVVVVAAVGQVIEKLPPNVELVHDRQPDRGPLEGLAAGWRAVRGTCGLAFATSCDVPLLVPEFVRRMCELASGFDAAVPRFEGRQHPLSAVYGTSVLPTVEELLAADRRRMLDLVAAVRARTVERAEFADVDPAGYSLRNVNSPADFRAALSAAGLVEPPGAADAPAR